MADEKKEPWLNYLALTTVLLAVCATLSTFKGGGYSTRSVMTQTKASDQWSYYQAKSIKGYMYEMSRDKLQLELKAMNATDNVKKEYEAMISKYSDKVAEYEKDRKAIEAEARSFERERDSATAHSKVFGWAVIFLQIAILLSSIAALMKQPMLWVAGLVCGLVGAVFFANGFFMFFTMP